MNWLLSLDMGSNSIGWWAYSVTKDQNGIWQVHESIDGGVRLFPDGREPSSPGRVGDSLAVERRTARGMRRNRDRMNSRHRKLIDLLIAFGLLLRDRQERNRLFQTNSNEIDQNNPYRLRALSATAPVKPFLLGRALAHLGKRRGYQSNRKEQSDDDGGALKNRMDALHQVLGDRTLGQYLWEQHKLERNKPAKGSLKAKPGKIRFADGHAFFPTRHMYKHELETIRAVQQPHHSLTDDQWQQLAIYILDQRALRPVDRGKCEFFTELDRHWQDTPTGHFFRIYQELNNLRVIHKDLTTTALTAEQYQAILALLMKQKSPTFSGMRKQKDAAGNRLFPADSQFNLESEKRKGLKGHSLFIEFQKNPDLQALWAQHYEDGTLDDIFTALFEAEDDTALHQTLTADFGLSDAQASALTDLKLSRATSSLSLKAMQQLVSIMRDQGLPYWDAVPELRDPDGNALHHSHREFPQFDELPYYGAVMPEKMLGGDKTVAAEQDAEKHFGRINNPSVHVALNQVRKLVNTLVGRFGQAPVKIHVEVTRSLKQPKAMREEQERNQAKNERRNQQIRDLLKSQLGITQPTPVDVKKWKLWEELGKNDFERLCPFSGKNISASQLFSGEVQIEHILPFSRTLDNGFTNLTLAFSWANALKGNRSPFEAFGSGQHDKEGILWADIIHRIKSLPRNKQWRFGEDAMRHFDENSGFIDRQLTDTAYMTRVTARYLKALRGVEQVVTMPGRLTSMIRGKWHLNGILSDDNKKTREDNRHHAIDAAVIGLIDRGLLNKISRLAARTTDGNLQISLPDLPDHINAHIRQRVPTILPSVRPDHSLQGKIFNETAYGLIDNPDGSKSGVTRKALAGLKSQEIPKIRDEQIRQNLQQFIADNPNKKLEALLAEFADAHGIKRVRLLIPGDSLKVSEKAPYKGYAVNSYICCDIWAIPPKKKGGKNRYEGVFWGYNDAVQRPDGSLKIDKTSKKPHPAARFVTRLFKNDLVEIGAPEDAAIFKIGGFSATNNRLDLRSPVLSDPPRKFESINQLGTKGIRRLFVSPDGRILRGGKR